jgi:hypothetical protein
LLGPFIADAGERRVQSIDRRSPILNELSALHVIKKLIVFRIE